MAPHSGNLGVTPPPDESRSHDGQIPAVLTCAFQSNTLLPGFCNGVSTHCIDILENWRSFIERYFCLFPIVHREAAHQYQAASRAFRHDVEKPLARNDSG